MKNKSDKLSEKRSSAERTVTATKFPHPVPATKREPPPVKTVKAWVKPVKTAEKLVCPWPKCGFVGGDKIFLAAHVRVHEKFSNQVTYDMNMMQELWKRIDFKLKQNFVFRTISLYLQNHSNFDPNLQVRRAAGRPEVGGNGAFAGRLHKFVGQIYRGVGKPAAPPQQQQQQQQFQQQAGPKKSRWGPGPAAKPTIAATETPIIRSCPECDHKTTDLVLHFKRRHSEEAAIVQEFYNKKKYSHFGIRRLDSP